MGRAVASQERVAAGMVRADRHRMRSPDQGGTRVSGRRRAARNARFRRHLSRPRERGARRLRHGQLRQDLSRAPAERHRARGARRVRGLARQPRRREGGDRDLVGPVQHLRGRGHSRPPRSLPGIRLHQPLGRHEGRARARAPGARARLLRTDGIHVPRTPAGRRRSLVPAVRQVRRARNPGADLLGDDLRQRSPLRHRSPAASRPRRGRLPRARRSSRRWAAGRGSPSWCR